jgi:hypothetical protein
MPLLLVAVLYATGTAQPTTTDVRLPRIPEALQDLRAGKTAVTLRSLETIRLYNDELNWINQAKTRNLFAGGLLQGTREYDWDGHVFGDWVESSGVDYAYAPDGTLTSAVTVSRHEVGWVPVSRTLYESQDGAFSRITDQVFVNGEFENVERSVFSVVNELIVAGQTETWDGDWRPVERFSLEETEEGVVQTSQTRFGGDWVDSTRHVYPGLTIETLWAAIEQLDLDFSDYAGLYFGLRFPDVVEQAFVDGEWMNVSRQTTDRVYDLFTGRLVKETILTEGWDGQEWIPESRLVVDYTASQGIEGAPSRTAVQIHDGDAWVDLFVETYIIQIDIRRIVQSTLQADLGTGMVDVSQIRIEWIGLPVLGTEPIETPSSLELDQNHPNPFNPSTQITYRLNVPAEVRLAVFDVHGREVAVLDSGLRTAGVHVARWDAQDMSSGTYLYQLEAGGKVESRTMVLLK